MKVRQTIYIRTALQALSSFYPNLVETDANGEAHFSFRCLKFSDSNTGKFFKLNGGTGHIASFMEPYRDEFKFFRGVAGIAHPVIILLDNDSGADPVIKAIKSVFKISINRSHKWTHIYNNFYLVLTPLVHGKDATNIEDLFNPDTRSIKINGKSFECVKGNDSELTYSKKMFADKIAEMGSSSIDFSLFCPLFDRLSDVIASYNRRRNQAAQ